MPTQPLLKSLPLVRGLHLDRSDRQDWSDAAYWLTATLLGGLMPLWLPALLLLLFGQFTTITTFTKNGELALFAASLLSASFYTVRGIMSCAFCLPA